MKTVKRLKRVFVTSMTAMLLIGITSVFASNEALETNGLNSSFATVENPIFLESLGTFDRITNFPSSIRSKKNTTKTNPFAPVIIYDTTHAGLTGVEFSSAANGPATQMGDLVTFAGTNRSLTNISIDIFVLNDTSPFTLTMKLYTDCSAQNATGSSTNTPCGSGTGKLIPNSTVTIGPITPPAAGQPFTVSFPYNNLNLSGETDNTIAVSVNASRPNVLWILDETPVVGTSADMVERCGSAGANNGCARVFGGVVNNFAMTITADMVTTASGVTVSGRVLRPNGSDGVPRAVVSMSDKNGQIRTAKTDTRGNFKFEDVLAGESYIFNVNSTRYEFNSQVITVTENFDNLNFTATQ